MILPGGGSRLQTLGGLAAQLFDSTLRTSLTMDQYKVSDDRPTGRASLTFDCIIGAVDCLARGRLPARKLVCMILPGGESRLQTLGGLAAQLFDSTLRTSLTMDQYKVSDDRPTGRASLTFDCIIGAVDCLARGRLPARKLVCMILPGGESRLQTLGGLAAQLFDSTLRTLATSTLAEVERHAVVC